MGSSTLQVMVAHCALNECHPVVHAPYIFVDATNGLARIEFVVLLAWKTCRVIQVWQEGGGRHQQNIRDVLHV